MILSKLLTLLLRHIRRRIVNRILCYCRRAGWPEKEIHHVRWALIMLLRILLRLLRERFIQRNAAASFSPDNASC